MRSFQALLLFVFTTLPCWALAADRPSAPKLLPSSTLAYVRVHDSREFVDKFNSSALGQIIADEQMKPLVGELYGAVVAEFAAAEAELGLSLTQLLTIPRGEVCFAVVDVMQSRPAAVLLLEVGENNENARTLIARGEEALASQGRGRSTETFNDVELIVHEGAGRRQQKLIHFEKDGVICITSNLDVAKGLITVWDGEAGEDFHSFAENRKFTTIMKRCAGEEGERPQFTWFVDPIDIAKAAARGNTSGQLGLAMLPALGLDGLEAVGGSLIIGTEQFDVIGHAHLLLDSPRSGVLDLIAFADGDTTPEHWVPEDVLNYATLNWDVDATYERLHKLVDSFQGEGQFAKMIDENVSKELELDFEAEILDALDGRVTYFSWMQRPARWNSQSHLVAVKLRDADVFRRTFDGLMEKYQEQLTRQSYGGVVYYQGDSPEPRRQRPGQENDAPDGQIDARVELRTPEPCIAILDDYVVMTGSTELLHKCITAHNTRGNSLAKQLDFKLIASKIERQLGDLKAGMISFERPEESLRLVFDVVNSEDTRKQLARGAENNNFLRSVDGALKNNPLPPFEAISKYLAPGGSMLTDDETGLHYTTFTLRRKSQ